jgi:hypothetical protein
MPFILNLGRTKTLSNQTLLPKLLQRSKLSMNKKLISPDIQGNRLTRDWLSKQPRRLFAEPGYRVKLCIPRLVLIIVI